MTVQIDTTGQEAFATVGNDLHFCAVNGKTVESVEKLMQQIEAKDSSLKIVDTIGIVEPVSGETYESIFHGFLTQDLSNKGANQHLDAVKRTLEVSDGEDYFFIMWTPRGSTNLLEDGVLLHVPVTRSTMLARVETGYMQLDVKAEDDNQVVMLKWNPRTFNGKTTKADTKKAVMAGISFD